MVLPVQTLFGHPVLPEVLKWYNPLPMITDPDKSASAAKNLARQLGFDLVGITSAEPLPQAGRRLLEAVEKGHTADMSYLQRKPSARAQPKSFAPWARSVICLGLNYNTGQFPPSQSQLPLSRYAMGRDYHLVLAEKLRLFSQELEKLLNRKIRSRIAVDTSPLMEKALAQRAGLGWQGKNTLIINDKFGSWIFLAELLVDLELTPDVPAANHCGQCRACLDACPTGALSEPGLLDARSCLSFLTIENKGDIPPQIVQKAKPNEKEKGPCLFGCDICQEVCPFNHDTPRTSEKQFFPSPQLQGIALDNLAHISEDQFVRIFAGTPVSRLSYHQFLRNLQTLKQTLL